MVSTANKKPPATVQVNQDLQWWKNATNALPRHLQDRAELNGYERGVAVLIILDLLLEPLFPPAISAERWNVKQDNST